MNAVCYLIDRFQTQTACGRHEPNNRGFEGSAIRVFRETVTGLPELVTCIACRAWMVDFRLERAPTLAEMSSDEQRQLREQYENAQAYVRQQTHKT